MLATDPSRTLSLHELPSDHGRFDPVHNPSHFYPDLHGIDVCGDADP